MVYVDSAYHQPARYAHELFEMYTYPNILSIRESKYNNRQDMQYHLFGHIPDTANEWDFYPVVILKLHTILANIVD